jgi:hypothetical protein
MARHTVARTALFLSALLLAACTGDPVPVRDGGNGSGDPAEGDSGGDSDADVGAEDAGEDASTDAELQLDGAACKAACEPGDCETVPDGCGGFLTCDVCAQGEICGLDAPNKCGVPRSSCTPIAAAVACAGQCGSVSDGCDSVITCSADNGGVTCLDSEVCGGYGDKLSPNHCVAKPSCSPRTCTDLGLACGLAGDGCGGTLDCTTLLGGCGAGKTCGTGVDYGSCVSSSTMPVCQALTAAVACAGTCGVVSDGCTGSINCGLEGFGCPNGTTCGGGGVLGQCGAGPTCTAQPVATACANTCGQVSDGCSGVYSCSSTNGGLTCKASEECIQGHCVATTSCTPLTAGRACPGGAGHKSCGQQSDLCGGTVDCGGCATDEECGLGGPSLCGSKTPVCVPIAATTACAGKCGSVANGCGGTYSCDSSNGGVTCTGSEFCGAKTANTCGAPPVTCTPHTCAELGHSCGLASDGCGHILNCWPTCSPSSTSCAGACDSTSACLTNVATGAQSCVTGAPTCVGPLCGTVATSCTATTPTRLTGTVRTPGLSTFNKLPVPNALVYIPADPSLDLPAIFEGVSTTDAASCGRCGDEKLVADGQTVLAAAVTDYKGEFTLEGRIPVGAAFELVVKVGKWRRVVQVPAGVSQACATRGLNADYTRLSASSTDGLSGTHLPKIAISTGAVDAMECVFHQLGIADAEFTSPTGAGRLHMYRAADYADANGRYTGGGALPTSGVTCDGRYASGRNTIACSDSNRGTPNYGCYMGYAGCSFSNNDSRLYGTNAALNTYDLTVFDCEGYEHTHGATGNANIIQYVDHGGRMFASHFAYTFLENNGSLDASADWGGVNGNDNTATGYISLPSGATARTRANVVKSVLLRDWLSYQGDIGGVAGELVIPAVPSFEISKPRDRAGANVGPATDEWVYRNNPGAQVQQLSFNTPYAAANDHICGRVAYSGFHVSNTSAGGAGKFFPAICGSARALNTQEKILAFMLFDLATCVSAGEPPKPPACVPKTVSNVCPGVNDACGVLNDGCGGVVDCGGCASFYYCDGNSCIPNECTPATCASLGFTCGNHADGCGGIARNAQGVEGCGTCSNGQICGFSSPGVCGGCVQIPKATACLNKTCGVVSDGCGGTFDCGTCGVGQVCGAAGANVCGAGSCQPTPQATACANKTCGLVSDGCGGSYSCGTCTSPDTCGGGGLSNVCGHPTCTPLTSQTACANKQCGWVSDGCGGAIQCGTCTSGGVCGGTGPNLCGGSCEPTTCTQAGANCGTIADRCGALLSCGECPQGQTCGAGGPNICGSGPACVARTCTDAGASCGLTGDGCGGVLDCGTCTAPSTCGGAGVSNQCGLGDGGCNRLSCSAQSVACGQATDGCGGLLDCGACAPGYTCERGACVDAFILR